VRLRLPRGFDLLEHEGAARQTIQAVLLARQVNVGHMVVFVDTMDLVAGSDRAEIEQLIEMENGALLAAHGYRDVRFVFGSALKALAAAERGDLEGPGRALQARRGLSNVCIG